MFKFELGVEVKHIVTGFQGIVTGRSDYITGCNQYSVQPQVSKDGTWKDGRWCDEHALEQVGKKKIVVEQTDKPGCDTTPPAI